LAGNAVKILLSYARDCPAALGSGLHHFDFLELLKDVPDHTGRSLLEGEGAGAAVLGAAKLALQSAHPEARLKVDLAGDGSGARVVPVRVIWGQLLVDTSLNQVRPFRELQSNKVRTTKSANRNEVDGWRPRTRVLGGSGYPAVNTTRQAGLRKKQEITSNLSLFFK